MIIIIFSSPSLPLWRPAVSSFETEITSLLSHVLTEMVIERRGPSDWQNMREWILRGFSSLIWCLYGPVALASVRCSPCTAVTFSRLHELLSCRCAFRSPAGLSRAEFVTFIQATGSPLWVQPVWIAYLFLISYDHFYWISTWNVLYFTLTWLSVWAVR